MNDYTPQKAVFFDLDDTLYDHLIPFRLALQSVLSTGIDFPYEPAYHRLRYFSDKLSAERGGTPTQGHDLEEMRTSRFQLALAEFDIILTTEQAAAVQAQYLNKQFQIEMFEGARELIQKLQAHGYLVGVITNGPPEHQMNKIQALNLEEFIPSELFFISGAVGITKPDRKLFEHVTDKFELSPENCYYIGDSWRNDVVGASSAGWNVIWFNHRGVEPESAHRPHQLAKSYTDLTAYLLGDK
ncbi:HAD family hydrolase [Paenibacillus anaericanus]|uniref:HAD family hydrolase n=1 Tax=Paenibacillus anaericanus TaxID=170367 RepID=A0A433YA04_9BACL|nr:HAD family hydrolase [Paenibacillus anaericanus]RUT46740.1 HAD family hydrolase [Paenibacillus anaericanus]